MKIAHSSPDLLILRFTRWKGPLIWGALTLASVALAALLVFEVRVPTLWLLVWLVVTVGVTLPMALFRAEKSMLVLDARTGQATLSHRTIRGLYQNTWPLEEVQSTRVTRRRNAKGSAKGDPKRHITFYVREGMDEGRHCLTKYTVPAKDALHASAVVSDWMRAWRKQVDSSPAPL